MHGGVHAHIHTKNLSLLNNPLFDFLFSHIKTAVCWTVIFLFCSKRNNTKYTSLDPTIHTVGLPTLLPKYYNVFLGSIYDIICRKTVTCLMHKGAGFFTSTTGTTILLIPYLQRLHCLLLFSYSYWLLLFFNQLLIPKRTWTLIPCLLSWFRNPQRGIC